MVYRYTLKVWDSENLTEKSLGEVIMCHEHRQMFIEPQFKVVPVSPVDDECPICRYQVALDEIKSRSEKSKQISSSMQRTIEQLAFQF